MKPQQCLGWVNLRAKGMEAIWNIFSRAEPPNLRLAATDH